MPAFVKELSFVAVAEEKIVGNIVYSKAKLINDENKVFEVLCLGPIGVLPSYQEQGVGSLLMNYSIERARKLGYKAIILFGNHNYYQRFGFINAKENGIQTSWGENFDEFMALELYDGGLQGMSGKYYEEEVFKKQKMNWKFSRENFLSKRRKLQILN